MSHKTKAKALDNVEFVADQLVTKFLQELHKIQSQALSKEQQDAAIADKLRKLAVTHLTQVKNIAYATGMKANMSDKPPLAFLNQYLE